MKFSVTPSFLQDQPHSTKSDRFVAIQPAALAEVMASHGLHLGHLKTGKARIPENANHQTTIARYVADDSSDIVEAIGNGSSLDVLIKVPHLTGAVEIRVGFFRGTCANQWNCGKILGSVRISHIAGCLEAISRAIPAVIEQRSYLVDTIRQMSNRQVTPAELAMMARCVARLRLAGMTGVSKIAYTDLLVSRRADDRKSDLFTVINVLQENALRHGFRYETERTNALQETAVRHCETRKIVETTASAMDLTGDIWSEACALLAS